MKTARESSRCHAVCKLLTVGVRCVACFSDIYLAYTYGSFPKQGDPNINPQNPIILIMGTPRRGILILGNPLMAAYITPIESLKSL